MFCFRFCFLFSLPFFRLFPLLGASHSKLFFFLLFVPFFLPWSSFYFTLLFFYCPLFSTSSLEHVRADLLPLFSYLAQDDQDTVRLLAAEACVFLSRVLPREEAITEILPAVQTAAKDRSWRVRCVVADKWADLQKTLGPDITRAELVPILSRLLQDQEPEVRAQTAGRLPNVGAELAPQDRAAVIATSVLPQVAELCGDM